MATKKKSSMTVVHAVRFNQGDNVVYCFALPGKMITNIADFSRVKRNEKDKLEGFQRKEIQAHVNQITDYLDRGHALFPNAIILALGPQLLFTKARGTKVEQAIPGLESGRLHIPTGDDEDRVAWIVDGQQRSLALAKSKNGDLLVPIIAFESSSLDIQRQQFILVNRAKPLNQRLINELLPETEDAYLPRNIAINKIPSELCNLLDSTPKSPFYNRVNRMSKKNERNDMITDSAIIHMIKERINLPTGALTHFKGYKTANTDINGMLKVLIAYWGAVAETFPEAWKLPPDKSRLTHSVGIRAMGTLMDRISSRVRLQDKDLKTAFSRELALIASRCAWTSGKWPMIDADWNSIEMTTKSLNQLSSVINTIYIQSDAS
jgi:DGQHR domain-containing protein